MIVSFVHYIQPRLFRVKVHHVEWEDGVPMRWGFDLTEHIGGTDVPVDWMDFDYQDEIQEAIIEHIRDVSHADNR